MKRTKGRSRRSEAEIRRLVAGYESGNQSRAAYCAEHGVPLTTLDYYRRRLRPAESALVEIDLHGPETVIEERATAQGAVAVVLRNGRRLEIEWADIARLTHRSQPLRGLLDLLEEA
ncbi:MAG: hypothetical protein HYX27_13990 [Acidobacteria bacterium]|nr:hypothetical protein [Acidobacteriota bacterium]